MNEKLDGRLLPQRSKGRPRKQRLVHQGKSAEAKEGCLHRAREERQVEKRGKKESTAVGEDAVQEEILTLEREVYITWCSVGDSLSFSSHTQIASFLLDNYLTKDEGVAERICSKCGTALSWLCSQCLSEYQISAKKTSDECGHIKAEPPVVFEPDVTHRGKGRKRFNKAVKQEAEASSEPQKTLHRRKEQLLPKRLKSDNNELNECYVVLSPLPVSQLGGQLYRREHSQDNTHIFNNTTDSEKNAVITGNGGDSRSMTVDQLNLLAASDGYSRDGYEEAITRLDSDRDREVYNASPHSICVLEQPVNKNSLHENDVTDFTTYNQSLASLCPLDTGINILTVLDVEMPALNSREAEILNLEDQTALADCCSSLTSVNKSSDEKDMFTFNSNSMILNKDTDLFNVNSDILSHLPCTFTLARHSGITKVRKIHLCAMCKKVFNSVSLLKIHQTEEHGKRKLFYCSVCRKEFIYNFALMKHIKAHLVEESLSGITFSEEITGGNDSSHIGGSYISLGKDDDSRDSDNTNDYYHSEGQESRNETSNKGDHFRQKAHGKMRLVQCGECGQECRGTAWLQKHQQTHHTDLKKDGENADAVCSICGLSFQHKSSLIKHMDLHNHPEGFDCDVCHRSFKYSASLKQHKEKHLPGQGRVCETCGKKFTNKAGLTQHRLRHFGMKRHKCHICGAAFHENSNLKQHMVVHSQDYPYKCDICQRAFRLQNAMKQHRKTHSGLKHFRCDICGAAFTRNTSLRNHQASQHDIGQAEPSFYNNRTAAVCQVCGKLFSSMKSLKDHVQRHTDGPKMGTPCNICGKAFTNRSYLKMHLALHENPAKFECDICHKYCTSAGALYTHKQLHSGKKEHICETCGRAFVLYANLALHRKTHSTVRPWCCDQCGKTFKYRNNLKEHIKIHEPKEHTCKICNKSFSAAVLLDQHQYKHTDLHPYVCSICNMGFKLPRNLKLHMTTRHISPKLPKRQQQQAKMKNYECKVCHKTFACSTTLRDHETVHSSERPYVCNTCGKAFKLPRALKAHMESHSEHRPFHCALCNLSFKRGNGLKRHLDRTHSENRVQKQRGFRKAKLAETLKFERTEEFQVHIPSSRNLMRAEGFGADDSLDIESDHFDTKMSRILHQHPVLEASEVNLNTPNLNIYVLGADPSAESVGVGV